MAGLYFHIPFCRKACTYCDFHFSTSTSKKSEIVAALADELSMRSGTWESRTLRTIYFGGGTPSLLEDGELAHLLDAAAKNFDLSQVVEITLEANPDDISADKIRSWKKLGINRLSIGIQSFDTSVLKWMNRIHTPEQAQKSIDLALDAGFTSSSIDLIYGFPALKDADWRNELNRVLSSGIRHISAYNLTVEEKTLLHNRIQKGIDPPLCDDDGTRQLNILQEALGIAGWEHYEISNACVPGFRSKHNSSYWSREPYLGIGPSAHSFNGVSRRWNVANNHLYLDALKNGACFWEEEELNRNDRINEMIMLGLRTSDGIRMDTLLETERCDLLELSAPEIDQMQKRGWIVLLDGTLKITGKGMAFADHIASSLFIPN
ncbi:MAG: radical SAM family heme chaperone HemW [Flavobacteriales bacterium]|nr:radical SAM family heme chaperone HemW [Flavobacteriales bacterium]